MKDAKETERKLIELRNGNYDYSYEELAVLLNRSTFYVRGKCLELLKKGLISPAKKGPKKKKTTVIITDLEVIKPKNLNCYCDYPACRLGAVFTFSLVPLCLHHYEVIKDESDLYYSAEEDSRKLKRKHWDKISKRSAELWANQKASTFIQTQSKQSV